MTEIRGPLQENLRLNATTITKYDDFKNVVLHYFRIKQHYHPSSSTRDTSAPMDIGAYWRKGKGKYGYKRKDKGTGKFGYKGKERANPIMASKEAMEKEIRKERQNNLQIFMNIMRVKEKEINKFTMKNGLRTASLQHIGLQNVGATTQCR